MKIFYFSMLLAFALFLIGCTLYVETREKDRLLLTTERLENEKEK